MNLTIIREELLAALQIVIGVVERRNTLPILSHVLIEVQDDSLAITATDLEVELQGFARLPFNQAAAAITVPGRKLFDICKALPEKGEIRISLEKQQVILNCGRSRFSLMSLPAQDFPRLSNEQAVSECVIKQQTLRNLMEKTHVAMAQQDVRYYLNGMLFELTPGNLTLVATDGHRLALASEHLPELQQMNNQVILPRKGIQELLRLLAESQETVCIAMSSHALKVTGEKFVLTSKLIDGKFPDYQKVIPRASKNKLVVNKQNLKEILSRAAILSNEKYRGIRIELTTNKMKVVASNPEHEEAEEEISVQYDGEALTLGFNVNYLLDALGIYEPEELTFSITDANVGVLIQAEKQDNCLYVVMPMRI